jgi:hypothetical protein
MSPAEYSADESAGCPARAARPATVMLSRTAAAIITPPSLAAASETTRPASTHGMHARLSSGCQAGLVPGRSYPGG